MTMINSRFIDAEESGRAWTAILQSAVTASFAPSIEAGQSTTVYAGESMEPFAVQGTNVTVNTEGKTISLVTDNDSNSYFIKL